MPEDQRAKDHFRETVGTYLRNPVQMSAPPPAGFLPVCSLVSTATSIVTPHCRWGTPDCVCCFSSVAPENPDEDDARHTSTAAYKVVCVRAPCSPHRPVSSPASFLLPATPATPSPPIPSLQPFLGSSDSVNQVSGKIKLGKEVLATLDGHWVRTGGAACPPTFTCCLAGNCTLFLLVSGSHTACDSSSSVPL